MMVYIFGHDKQVRRIAPENSITDLVHDEAAYTIDAAVSEDLRVQNGEHIGFRCVDGHFRLFTVTKRDNDDSRHQTIIKATDAIVQELKEATVEELQQLDVGLKAAIEGLIAASDTTEAWEVIGAEPDRLEKSRAYFSSVWTMLETYKTLYEWQILPYYSFENGKISKRVIELQEDVAVFRGRILKSRKDAANVSVIKNNPPVTRLYGVGASTGSGDMQTNLTFAEVEWSVAKGDPVDKPKGQSWVEDPEAVAKYGRHGATAPFNDVEDPAELLKKTWEHLQTVKEPSCTVEANIQDLERAPGHEHQIIRLGDLVPIRLTNATMETARVIGIKRDYIRHWLTKLTIGDKTATVQSQVSSLIVSAAHTFERLTIFKNRFHEDEALIQLNAEHIQLNATTIMEHAEQILLKAEKEDLDAAYVFLDGVTETLDLHGKTINIHGESINTNAENISANAKNIQANADAIAANAKTISLKASQDDLEAVELSLDGVNNTLTTHAGLIQTNAGTINTQAETIKTQAGLIQANADAIDANAKTISLKASQGDLDAVELTLDGVNNTMTAQAGLIKANADAIAANAGTISLQAEEIQLKADKTYVDNLVANYATVEEMDSVRAWISDLEGGLGTLTVLNAGTANITDANTTYLSAASFTFAGGLVSRQAISMGEVSTAGGVLSTGELNLQHSHKITEENGVVTLGEVSSSGGSFNIAETSFYKKGVEAAIQSVTVYGPTVDHVEHPGGTSHLMRVYMQGKASNGATSAVVSELISAQPVYDVGYNDGYAAGYQAAKDATKVVGGITSIVNTAQNYYQANGWASAQVDGE